MRYLKLRFGMLPLTHKHNVLGNIKPLATSIALICLLGILTHAYNIIGEQTDKLTHQNKQIISYETELKNKAEGSDSKVFVLLQDPVITKPICDSLKMR